MIKRDYAHTIELESREDLKQEVAFWRLHAFLGILAMSMLLVRLLVS